MVKNHSFWKKDAYGMLLGKLKYWFCGPGKSTFYSYAYIMYIHGMYNRAVCMYKKHVHICTHNGSCCTHCIHGLVMGLQNVPQYTLSKRLSGFWKWSGCFGKEKNLLPLPETDPSSWSALQLSKYIIIYIILGVMCCHNPSNVCAREESKHDTLTTLPSLIKNYDSNNG